MLEKLPSAALRLGAASPAGEDHNLGPPSGAAARRREVDTQSPAPGRTPRLRLCGRQAVQGPRASRGCARPRAPAQAGRRRPASGRAPARAVERAGARAWRRACDWSRPAATCLCRLLPVVLGPARAIAHISLGVHEGGAASIEGASLMHAARVPQPHLDSAADAHALRARAGRVDELLQAYDRERRVLPPPVRMWQWGWTKSAETWNGRIGARAPPLPAPWGGRAPPGPPPPPPPALPALRPKPNRVGVCGLCV